MKHPLLLHYGIKNNGIKNNDNTKGIITLTILIFISGLLTAFLLLDDNHLSFFGRNKINENTMWKEHYNCKK